MKKLILAGSGEFTDALLEIDQKILDLISKKDPQVVIIPTAAGQESDFYKWIEMGISHFKKLGIEAIGLPITDQEGMGNKQYLEIIEKADLVYFSGGHPGYLFQSLAGTKMWQIIKDRYEKGDLILAGSSAGAMVMGNWVFSNAPDFFYKKGEVEIDKGLGLVDFLILPHFDKISEKEINEFTKLFTGEILGIDEDTVLIIMGDEKKVLGSGKVVEVNR